MNLLQEHVNPKPVVMVERHKLAQQCQGNKTVTQFFADLRKAAEYCVFGDFYGDALRDRFICGLSDASIRKALLSEVKKRLKLSEAFSKALAREQTGANAKVVVGGESDTNFVKTQQKGAEFNQNWKQNNSERAQDDTETYKFCKLRVSRSKCSTNQFKTSCILCGKIGHQKKFCFKNPKNSSHNSHSFNELY